MGETESVQSPDLYEENNCELPMQRRRVSALKKMSAWLMLGLYSPRLGWFQHKNSHRNF